MTIDHSSPTNNATFANRNHSIQQRSNVDSLRPVKIAGQSIDAGVAQFSREGAGSRSSHINIVADGPLQQPLAQSLGQQPQYMSPERRGLAEPRVGANGGGIGVSYSNVVLAGGVNPKDASVPVSSAYMGSFDQQKGVGPQFSKGLEFNARVKYDFNIVNNQGS